MYVSLYMCVGVGGVHMCMNVCVSYLSKDTKPIYPPKRCECSVNVFTCLIQIRRHIYKYFSSIVEYYECPCGDRLQIWSGSIPTQPVTSESTKETIAL